MGGLIRICGNLYSGWLSKAQYERWSLGENSDGRLTHVQPGFVLGGKVNVVTVAVDFVF